MICSFYNKCKLAHFRKNQVIKIFKKPPVEQQISTDQIGARP